MAPWDFPYALRVRASFLATMDSAASDTQDSQSSAATASSSAWDALLSVQKENARLRELLAAAKPPPKPRTSARLRGLPAPKRRGRPPKRPKEDGLISDEGVPAPKRGRGRSKRSNEPEDELVSDEEEADFSDALDAQLKVLEAAQQRVQSEEARLEAMAAHLRTKSEAVEADRADLTKTRRQWDEQCYRAKRQFEADNQQNFNRIKEMEKRLKAEQRQVEKDRSRLTVEWARVAEWKGQFDKENG
ncbi:hypothetical protein C8R47DRAFT_1156709 [Mycena vitilis]|nr:hypothetical protein C8R47DRAFT_1156709 [Mycena vitilis]